MPSFSSAAARSAAALSSLEEGNNAELDDLYNKVTQMKHLSMQINADLDDDKAVRAKVGAQVEASQTGMLSTLDNLSSSFAQASRASTLKIAGLVVVAMILLYLVLTVRL